MLYISIVFNVFIALTICSKFMHEKRIGRIAILFSAMTVINTAFFYMMPSELTMPELLRGILFTSIVFFIAFFYSIAITNSQKKNL